MKIRSKTILGAIKQTPDNFCNLLNVTDDGYVIYSVKYQADLSKIIPNKHF